MGYDIYRLDAALNRVPYTNGSLGLEWADPGYAAGVDGRGPAYFRRNMWGGSALAALLEKHGLGFWPTVPAWRDAVGELPDEIWELEGAERYAAAPKLKAHLMATYSETPGIALHKLAGSNDGWIITPLEYHSMLGLFDQLSEEIRQELLEAESLFGPDFYAFAKACEASGGSKTC